MVHIQSLSLFFFLSKTFINCYTLYTESMDTTESKETVTVPTPPIHPILPPPTHLPVHPPLSGESGGHHWGGGHSLGGADEQPPQEEGPMPGKKYLKQIALMF